MSENEKQSFRSFSGGLKVAGIDDLGVDEAPPQKPATEKKRPARVSINMPEDVYEDLRSAQYADLMDLGDQAASSLDRWVQAAVERWADLTPARRESRLVGRTGSGTIRSYVMTDTAWERLDGARAADLERRGPIGRSTFAAEAVQWAIEETRKRRGGGPLPSRPKRRSTKTEPRS
ncbi:hypothetical protein [Calidifontibacter terrae]